MTVVQNITKFQSFPLTPEEAPTTNYQVANKKYVDDNGGGAGMTISPWLAIATGAYASTSTFTFTGTASEALMILQSLFTCEDSAGTTRRIGFVKSASESGGTVTVTVVTDTVMAAGDINFKIAPNRKITDYKLSIFVPNETVADASNPQGKWWLIKDASYLISMDIIVGTAAAGAGASCAVNVYENATNLFTSAVDLTTNASAYDNVPTADNSLAAGSIFTARVTAVGGATNKAANLLVDAYIVPQNHYLGAE